MVASPRAGALRGEYRERNEAMRPLDEGGEASSPKTRFSSKNRKERGERDGQEQGER